MSDSRTSVRGVVLFTIVVVIIVLAAIFLLEDSGAEFSYPVN